MGRSVGGKLWALIPILFLLFVVSCDFSSHNVYSTVPETAQQVSRKLTKIGEKTYTAAVSITSIESGLVVKGGSGTYLDFYGHDIVLTACHVIENSAAIMVEGRKDEFSFAYTIYVDNKHDICVLKTFNELKTRTAIKYRPYRADDLTVGTEVVYTGFPNQHDLLSITGKVAGQARERQSVLLHSYAWMGASGSGVFDYKGRLLGVLSAVDVGYPFYPPMPQVIEDIVWVAPIWIMNESQLRNKLDDMEKERKASKKDAPLSPSEGQVE